MSTRPPWATHDEPVLPGRTSMIVNDSGIAVQSRPPSGKAGRSAVALILDPERAERAERRRRGASAPRDHMRENVQRMRQVQSENRARRSSEQLAAEQAEVERQQRAATAAYRHVPSKVTAALEKGPAEAPRPQSAAYLRRGSKNGPPSHPQKPVVRRPSTAQAQPDVLDVPVTRDVGTQSPERRRGAERPRSSAAPASRPSTAHRTGEVPGYLKKRQQKWQEEERERQARIEDPGCPPGYTTMPDAERLQTLADLRKSMDMLMEQLRQVPVTSSTLRSRKMREELEDQLSDVEKAIKHFSRAKVYVRKE